VSSFSAEGGNLEAVQYRTEEQMYSLMYRATFPFVEEESS
jgi:hypothetical protein